MDKKQLVTIAITAAVSVMAKEIAGWLLTWAKIRSTSETAKAAVRKIFSKNNLKITWDVVWFVYAGWFFAQAVRDTSPSYKMGDRQNVLLDSQYNLLGHRIVVGCRNHNFRKTIKQTIIPASNALLGHYQAPSLRMSNERFRPSARMICFAVHLDAPSSAASRAGLLWGPI
jgi:hypothetical protein